MFFFVRRFMNKIIRKTKFLVSIGDENNLGLLDLHNELPDYCGNHDHGLSSF